MGDQVSLFFYDNLLQSRRHSSDSRCPCYHHCFHPKAVPISQECLARGDRCESQGHAWPAGMRKPHQDSTRRGTNGVSTNGVTADFMFFDRGTFWVLPLTYFYLPKSARAYLFPQPVKIQYFCSGPISVDPICLQSIHLLSHLCS